MRLAFSTAYLLSAAAALGLELMWSRSLALRLGSTALANAVVLGAFMAGLALGAWGGGRWAWRSARPQRAFAAAQLMGVVLAGLPMAPFIRDLLPASLAVILATVPLGLCFALAGAVRESDGSGRGAGLGRLWALDATGGAAGVLFCGLWGIWHLGLSTCLALMLGAKLLASLLALLQPGAGRTAPPEPGAPTLRPRWRLLGLVALQGFALLGAELIWSRLLSFTLYRGSTTFALSTMLATVLLGSAAGARWASGTADRGAAWARARISALLCALSVLASLGLLLLAQPVAGRSALSPTDLLLTFAVCGPASFFSGAVFAAACRASSSPAGQTAGSLLAANALGAMAGAALAPLLLVPGLGLSASLCALAGLCLLGSALLESGDPRGRLPRWLLRGALLPLGLALITAGPTWTRHLGQILFYDEGRDASVAVVEDPPGVRRLIVDGIAVAGTDLALVTDQKMLAHLPMLLRPQARRVLSVGFGAGGTSRAFLLHPEVEVDCVEISESVPRAAVHLREVNGGLPQNAPPRYRLHLADARRFLAESDQAWDLIVNDCTDLAYRSDASLYSQDFFQTIAAHLSPGGLAVAWVPIRGHWPQPSLQAVVAAFTSVFPHSSLWVFDAFPTHFGMLVGGQEPLAPDCATWRKEAWPEAVWKDLDSIGLADGARLAVSMHADHAALRRFAGDSVPHSDDRPSAEFLAALDTAGDASAYEFLRREEFLPPPWPMVCPDPDFRERMARRAMQRPWLLAGHGAWSADDPALARAYILMALRLDPEDAQVQQLLGLDTEDRALLALLQGRPERCLRALRQSPAGTRRDLLRCLALLDAGRPGEAATRLDSLRHRIPKKLWIQLRWRSMLPSWLAALSSPLTLPGL